LQVIRSLDRLTAGEIYRQYEFDPAARLVTLQIFYADNVGSEKYDLANNVSACRFESSDTKSNDRIGAASCVSMLITCSDSLATITLAGSASPRRATGEPAKAVHTPTTASGDGGSTASP
jgi:hypothetical protein